MAQTAASHSGSYGAAIARDRQDRGTDHRGWPIDIASAGILVGGI
jgi:hypothetical protein